MSPLNRRDFLSAIGRSAVGFAGASVLLRAGVWAETAKTKPNFVFILLDDMGWMDVGCNGSKVYETPNTDRLASQGVRFTNAYAACCCCSPTRASILTGKYPARLQLTDWIPGNSRPFTKLRTPNFYHRLNLEEITIAEALKKEGYTTACIGKWHLGEINFFPEKQGFDVSFGSIERGNTPSFFYPYGIWNITDGKPGEYLTDRLTTEAEKFIEQNKDKPFMLYLSHYAVHAPYQAKQEMIEKWRAKGRPAGGPTRAVYAAMLESMDESVGRIMAKLDELKLTDNTVIIFMSDNGGRTDVTSNAPLRGGKGTPYEGGVREPMIVRWPGVTKPGSTCDVPVISNDFYPTMLEMAGSRVESGQVLDGVSLVPLLKGAKNLEREAIYWHYPHYSNTTPNSAIRKGDFKLIEFFEDGRLELYNLAEDIGEKNNLATQMPDKTAELHKMLIAWRKEVRASMPVPNPDYRPPGKTGAATAEERNG